MILILVKSMRWVWLKPKIPSNDFSSIPTYVGGLTEWLDSRHLVNQYLSTLCTDLLTRALKLYNKYILQNY